MRVTGSAQPIRFLLDIIDVLQDLGIPYSVVGGLAVSVHGLPRSTNDGDVLLWLTDTGKTAKDVRDRLITIGYDAELRIAEIDDPVRGVVTVKDEFENQVDLLLGVRGMDPGAQSRSTTATLRDVPVSLMGPEDVIAMKLFAGAAQDLQDVQGIFEVSKEKLDIELARRLARQYGEDIAHKLEQLLSHLS